MESYNNLVEAISALELQGYIDEINLLEDSIEIKGKKLKLFHDEFEIDKIFRFDENDDPDDQSILYAISSEEYNIKGLLINGYGVSTDMLTYDMLKKLL
jgi:hypothetical protein